VDSAVQFARYVLWSGLISLFEEYARPEPLKVDGAFIRWLAEELQRECTERYRTNNFSPTFEQAEFQSIHDKLDLIAGHLSRVAPALSNFSASPSTFAMNEHEAAEENATTSRNHTTVLHDKTLIVENGSGGRSAEDLNGSKHSEDASLNRQATAAPPDSDCVAAKESHKACGVSDRYTRFNAAGGSKSGQAGHTISTH